MDETVDRFTKSHWKQLKKKGNVIGYSGDLQFKFVNGKQTKEKAVRIYVQRKLDPRVLSAADLVPTILTIDGLDVKTDIYDIGEIKSLGCYSAVPQSTPEACALGSRDRYRPLVIGPSGMGYWQDATACTMGGFAINKKPDEEQFVGILANNHCCARENKATKGNPYVQQSPLDGGKYNGDQVGKLWRFVELKFGEFTCPYRNALHYLFRVGRDAFSAQSVSNIVDIGLVRINDDIEYDIKVQSVGKMEGKKDAVVGDILEKYGRTTGLTTDGVVIDISWNGTVTYSRGTVTFTDCILVRKDGFSAGGDSSSFVYTKIGKEYVGNLFAGSGTHTIICKGKNVEKELQVEVLV